MGRLIIESKAACKGKEAMIGRDEIFKYVKSYKYDIYCDIAASECSVRRFISLLGSKHDTIV
jgi:hypothetical protein